VRKIAVIGLGYVGLPVAVTFAQHYPVIGFDINAQRIAQLREGNDVTGEITCDQLNSSNLHFTDDSCLLRAANCYIITVPTPLDENHQPYLHYLFNACEIVGKQLSCGDIVVFESTVYPGATEEACIPRLAHHSQLIAGRDFTVGYSPERINPADKVHTFSRIPKIVASNDADTLAIIAALYKTVIPAGVYCTDSIKVAEAAKVLENTQRDINIALMNECAILFAQKGIDTQAVIDAAKTKWNFIPFYPGLVGGHCVGVAPYYLTHNAEKEGYRPEMILAARRVNDSMAKYVASTVIKKMTQAQVPIKGARIGVLGVTFKENCKDYRDSKVTEIINEFVSYGATVLVHDALVASPLIESAYGITLCTWEALQGLNAIVLCVAHNFYKMQSVEEYAKKLLPSGVLMDVKALLDKSALEALGIAVVRL